MITDYNRKKVIILGNVRMMKNKTKQGIDGLTFELTLKGDLKSLDKQPLINERGGTYGSVEAKEGNAIVVLVLPRFVRDNNINPFSILDSIMLDVIKNNVEAKLTELFGDELDSKIKNIECNITQQISGNASQSDILNLFSKATLSIEQDNIKYVGPNRHCNFKEETHTVIVKRQHYHVLKVYDKTNQLMKMKQAPETIPAGLLRIEIIMIERTIEKLFGKKTTLSDVLAKDSLTAVLREYKRILCDEIIEKKIKPYLDKAVLLLIESLCETENPIETIIKQSELIVDKLVLQKALRKWQKIRGVSDNSIRDTELYTKKYCLPEDVILTIHDFRLSCG